MIRAVLDSSVLISAFITPRGTAAQVLDAGARGQFVTCLSLPILAETAGVLLRGSRLQRSYGFVREEVERFCERLAASAEMVTDLPMLRIVPGDPKDDPIVATAVAARASHLVTGDRRHLLPLGSHQGVAIVSVRAFLDLLDQA